MRDQGLPDQWLSRPSRACGLKREYERFPNGQIQVAPFTGVWIETTRKREQALNLDQSRPSRACGLKHL